jgi:hypothetical protein
MSIFPTHVNQKEQEYRIQGCIRMRRDFVFDRLKFAAEPPTLSASQGQG